MVVETTQPKVQTEETDKASNEGVILFIHGMFETAKCWRWFIEFFHALGFQCHAITLPYHLHNPTKEDLQKLSATGLQEYIEFLIDYIEEHGLDKERLIIVGHSMGGLLTQMLAARGYGRAIVLLAPAAPAGIVSLKLSVIKGFWSTIRSPRFWFKHWRIAFRLTDKEFFYSMVNKLPPAEQEKVYAESVYESGRAAAQIGFWPFHWIRKWILFGWLSDYEIPAEVDAKKITCPMLVFVGKHDRATPSSVVQKVADRYGAERRLLPDHGHWLVAEDGWEYMAYLIVDWIRIRQVRA